MSDTFTLEMLDEAIKKIGPQPLHGRDYDYLLIVHPKSVESTLEFWREIGAAIVTIGDRHVIHTSEGRVLLHVSTQIEVQ